MKNTAGKIAVIGGGSWATAIVKILISTIVPNEGFNWYLRNPETIKHILKNHHNPNYLSSVSIHTENHNIQLYNSLNDVIEQSDILIFAIPSAYLKNIFKNISAKLRNKIIISAIKGVIPEDNLIMCEYFNRVHKVSMKNIAVLSGPSHAEEVALERLSYLTLGSKRISLSKQLKPLFDCRFIKIRTSTDIDGIEYSAVLKNIYALAGGICNGLGFGDNFQAVLISNAMNELRKFVTRVKPIKHDTQMNALLSRFMKRVKSIRRNLNTSVYLGDLLVTSYSQFSRNRAFGQMIGKGYSVKSALLEMNMVAEGYFATKCIKEINEKFKVRTPIIDAVYNILYNGADAKTEIKILTTKLR